MAESTGWMERLIEMQALEIGRLRIEIAGLIADSREQAATIRTLVDRGVVAPVVETKSLGEQLRAYRISREVSRGWIAEKIGTTPAIIAGIESDDISNMEMTHQFYLKLMALIGGVE